MQADAITEMVGGGVLAPAAIACGVHWLAGRLLPEPAASRLPVVMVPDGEVELTGLVQRELPQVLELKRSPPPAPSQRIWQNLERDDYARWSGLRLQPLVIRQTEAFGAGDTLVRDWSRPVLDVDKHRGYAFQWYAIALATAVLWGWFVVLRPRLARRGGDGEAGDAGDAGR